MWLFLSVWTFNYASTLTALLMVSFYEIAAPVSWLLVAPSLAFDIWRIATPDDYAEDGPHHPIWHNPNTVFWLYLAFCVLTLLLAPLFSYSCFAEFNRMVEPYSRLVNRKLVEVGGVCESKYGNFLILYFLFIPIFQIIALAYLLFTFKRSRSRLADFGMFKRLREKSCKKRPIILQIFFILGFSKMMKFHAFDSYEGRILFVPGEYIFSFGVLQGYHALLFYLVALAYGTGTYLQLEYAEQNGSSRKQD